MPEAKRRGKQPDEESAPQVSRLARMQRDGIPPQLPPVAAGQYLVDWLFELGPTVAAGMGAGPLTFQEIGAWQSLMGITLQPWEARALRQLSQTYLSEAHEATKPNRPPPYGQIQRNPRLEDLIDRFL